MRMRADPASGYPGRTYRFYTGNPVFEFGHGLSYSTFAYKFKSVPRTPLFLDKSITVVQSKSGITSHDISKMSILDCEALKFSALIEVENKGFMDGKHSVLVFLRRSSSERGRAGKQLVGFESVNLKAGGREDVEFVLKPCEHFAHTEEDGRKVLDEGTHFLVVGEEEFEFGIMA
ncbi:putative beta-D-xylosidase 7 [Platanthera guangdongensis]|uniref:Beta-D-xylosidase 7 n=1 Tax=Platanthera guangdongensis TaxID=2320717 RepID=A0ABR2LHD2_9ASPA